LNQGHGQHQVTQTLQKHFDPLTFEPAEQGQGVYAKLLFVLLPGVLLLVVVFLAVHPGHVEQVPTHVPEDLEHQHVPEGLCEVVVALDVDSWEHRLHLLRVPLHTLHQDHGGQVDEHTGCRLNGGHDQSIIEDQRSPGQESASEQIHHIPHALAEFVFTSVHQRPQQQSELDVKHEPADFDEEPVLQPVLVHLEDYGEQ